MYINYFFSVKNYGNGADVTVLSTLLRLYQHRFAETSIFYTGFTSTNMLMKNKLIAQ